MSEVADLKKVLLGEVLGTFLLVFFGCGSLAVSVLFQALNGLLQIALIWGFAVTLGIYATRHLSCAHFNPAISLAMVTAGRMSLKKLPSYLLGQFLGAFLAAAMLYLLFHGAIAYFEEIHSLIRGSAESIQTAMIFTEFYPSPAAGETGPVTTWTAFIAEATGTFFFVLMIFLLSEGCNLGRPDSALAPVFIGLTLTLLITLLAPLTQAGFNPARDFSPRLFAYLAGWGQEVFKQGFFSVYILAPVLGGQWAAITFTKILEPALSQSSSDRC